MKNVLQFLLCLCLVSCVDECGDYIDYRIVNQTYDTLYIESWAPNNLPGLIYPRCALMKEVVPNDTLTIRQIYEGYIEDNGIQIVIIRKSNMKKYLELEELNGPLNNTYDARLTVTYKELRKYNYTFPITSYAIHGE